MDNSVHLLHFGDQTADIGLSIQKLHLLSKSSPALSQFLQTSADILTAEIGSLPALERSWAPFRTLSEFCEPPANGDASSVVRATVSLCICQLGWLLVQIEQEPRILDSESNRIVLGLCTGLLPAVTSAAINSTSELLKMSPEIIRISLKLGLEVCRQSQALDQAGGSWASAFSNVSLHSIQDAIRQFQITELSPPSAQLWISVIGKSTYTISGPSTTLQLFCKFAEVKLPQARRIELPIFGAYHGRHIYVPDFATIIEHSPILDRPMHPNTSILSTSSGHVMDTGQSLYECICNSLTDILLQPLNLAMVMENLAASELSEPNLTVIGPSNATSFLQATLKPSKYQNLSESGLGSRTGSDLEGSGDFAIVGMSGRFPGSNNPQEFWKVLQDGLDVHKTVPANRFAPETHCDPTGQIQNTTLSPYGCFVEHPDLFDARLFNMTPREAISTDPIHRLLLMTTYEALEMSGYSPNRTPATQLHRIGTFIGQTSDDWREVNAAQNIDPFWTPGGVRAFAPGRLNYYFGWEGPSYSIDAACSSSMAAIQISLTALSNRECDTAIVGGAGIMTSPDPFAGLSRGGFLSLTGPCKTWDAEADGYCRGDGIGTLVIKRLKDAIADRDYIQAVIKGISTNHSAEAVSITHPHAGTQERLFRKVLRDACIRPEEVDYIEMHGTGTQAGDVTELSSVAQAFSTRTADSHPLYIGTVKPNIGHGEASSGIASVMKSVLMFQKNMIPPHIGIKASLNPKIPIAKLDALNIKISKENLKFKPNPSSDGRRRILVNNFNAAGGNTALLLEDAPILQKQGIGQLSDPRSCHIVTISAKTVNSLHGNTKSILAFLQQNPDTNISDLCYTTTTRRMHHVYRSAYVATSVPELLHALQNDISRAGPPTKTNKLPAAIFVFSGQGSLYTGMGYELLSTCKMFRRSMQEIDEICRRLKLPSVLDAVGNPAFDYSECTSVQGQLVIVAFGIALASLWKSWGVLPQIVCGHSLGEYAALCVAGVLSIADTIYLVGQRAILIQQNCQLKTWEMLVISSSAGHIRQMLSRGSFPSCEIACLNGPETTVVSGKCEDVTTLKDHLRKVGVRTSVLEVPYAFHSAQLDPCLDQLETLARQVHFKKPKIPVASPLLGTVITEAGVFDGSYLARQARRCVDFTTAIQQCSKMRGLNITSTFWIEIGARPLALPMIKAILGTAAIQPLPSMSSKESNWLTVNKSLAEVYGAGFNVDWAEVNRDYESTLTLLPIPPYSFDLESYWLQYQGDWCLSKGRRTSEATTTSLPRQQFFTTTLQKVETEDFAEDGASVSFTSTFADPHLRSAVCGHIVNGIALVPSSIYADMACSAASYIWNHTESVELPAFDVSRMDVSKPLLLPSRGDGPLVRVTALKKSKSRTITVVISSQQRSPSGVEDVENARCLVNFGGAEEWLSQWAKQSYLIQGRITDLEQRAMKGEIHRLRQSTAYKLFSNMVNYGPKYQGMDEVFLDGHILEATAKVSLKSTPGDGIFTHSPYSIDSLGHLSGFILHVSESISNDVAFISNGWGSMRITKSLSSNASYQTYARMQETGKRGVMAGDIYILEEDKIIGVFEDVKFSSIKRTLLETLLPSNSRADEGVQAPATHFDRRLSTTEPTVYHGDKSFSMVVSCISEETGIPVEELGDGTELDDLGIDSLMSLMVTDKLQQQLQMKFPNPPFQSCQTLGDLRQFFEGLFAKSRKLPTNSTESSTKHSNITPETVMASPTDNFAEVFKSIIATECGINPQDIMINTPFADLGIDSLLGLSILSTVYDKTGQRLPSSFFYEHPTVADVQKAFNTPSTSELAMAPETTKVPQCTSVLLQGDPHSQTPTMFLLPDGSGSAGSYVGLPVLEGFTGRVFGINSPFLRCPEMFTVSLKTLAEIFVTEITRLDPVGPYLLGGWSIGGIYIYEATQILRRANKVVKALFLIDAPCPGTIPPLPLETVDLLDRLGIFNTPRIERNGMRGHNGTRQHFLGSIKALKGYHAEPMINDEVGVPSPKCVAIWARHGVWESVEERRGELLENRVEIENHAHKWIMDRRETYDGNGWERLVPAVEVDIVNGNHFTIMRQPQIKEIGRIIARHLNILK